MPRTRQRGGLGRAVTLSLGLHAAALLALSITVHETPPPLPPEEDTFAVEFGSSLHAQKGEHPAKVAAPADAQVPATQNPAVKPPEKAPLETAPPPPPPPPPEPQAEAVPKPPPPKPPEQPPKPAVKAPVKPPPPKPPVKPPPTPTPPPKVKSVRAQPNPTKNPAPDTHSLLNTLEKLMADQKQVAPPKHRYNPERGGAPGGGGARSGGLTGELSDGQRKQIGDEVRRCYSEDTEARDYATYAAEMVVTIDASGEARDVQLAPSALRRAAGDPAFRAFAERAQRAVLDPNCAHLPVPPNLLGKPAQTLNFRFRP